MDDEMVTFEQELLEAQDATMRARGQADRLVAQLDEKERERAELEGRVASYKGMENALLDWRDRARVAERDLAIALDVKTKPAASRRRTGDDLEHFLLAVCVCVFFVVFGLTVSYAAWLGSAPSQTRSVKISCPVGQPCPILDRP